MPVFFEVLLGACKNHFKDGLHQSLAQRLVHTGLSLHLFWGIDLTYASLVSTGSFYSICNPPPPALEHLNVAIN